MKNVPAAFASLLLLLAMAWSNLALAQGTGLPAPLAPQESAQEPEPSLDELIRILENEETRDRLVQSLKAAAYRAPTEEAASGEIAADEIVRSLPAQVAAYTGALVGGLAAAWEQVAAGGSEAIRLLSGADRIDLPRIFEAVLPVMLVAAIVFAVYFASRLIKEPVFRRLAARARNSGPLRKFVLLLTSSAVEALAVVLSWATGYVAALVFGGGAPGINQALFLNAFLVVEMAKAAMSGIIAPRYPDLRLTPFGDRNASYWYFWLSRLVSLIGYAFLFVAPVVQRSSSLAAADAVRFIVAFSALALVLFLVLRNRRAVRDRLGRRYAGGERGSKARVYALLGHVWHLLAIALALAFFIAWLTSPEEGLPFMAAATVKSLAAILAGGLIMSVLSRIISKGVRVPARTRERLPLLEARVNAFIPAALMVIRVLVILVVIAAVLDIWGLATFNRWIATPVGQRFASGLMGAGLVLFLGFAFFLIVSSWIEYRLNPNFGRIPTARERTLLSLFRNGFSIALAVIVAMLVLSQIGINIAPLIAGAGVVGLAVGFGAQKLVQDIITGAFIQLENAMNEGDVVQVAGVSGLVERLTIRSVGLRAVDGTYHLIPFSSVDQVANMTKDFSHFVADVSAAYWQDTDAVKALMRDAFAILMQTEQGPNVIDDFEMMGVERLAESAVVVRGRIKTLPGKQWGVGRVYNEIVKRLCDERGVEIPFPQMTLHFGTEKTGGARPQIAAGIANRSAPEPLGKPRAEAAAARRETRKGEPTRSVPGDRKHKPD